MRNRRPDNAEQKTRRFSTLRMINFIEDNEIGWDCDRKKHKPESRAVQEQWKHNWQTWTKDTILDEMFRLFFCYRIAPSHAASPPYCLCIHFVKSSYERVLVRHKHQDQTWDCGCSHRHLWGGLTLQVFGLSGSVDGYRRRRILKRVQLSLACSLRLMRPLELGHIEDLGVDVTWTSKSKLFLNCCECFL